jgi:hypothetical protein
VTSSTSRASSDRDLEAAAPGRAACAVTLVGAVVALVAWSFGKWTDPLIDFGFELYVPWRLSEGEVLYTDIAYRNGPFSAYWNAGWFSLFGVSVRTLVVANLLILCAIVALLFDLLERAVARYAALVGVLAFLALCAFSQYGNVGNYNFVTPYQHGQTHGLLLGLVLLRLLHVATSRRSLAAAGGAGAVLGALFLTKAEVFVPGLLAAAVSLGLAVRSGRAGAQMVAAVGVAAAVPFAVAVALLASKMPAASALRGALGNWPYLTGAVSNDPFYAATAGMDAPVVNAAAMLGFGLLIASLGLALRWLDARAPKAGVRAWGVAAVVIGAVLGWMLNVPTNDFARALPLAMWALVCTSGRAAFAGEARAGERVVLAVFALALLGKLGLHPQVAHYGFALAAPALALSVALAVAPWRSAAVQALALGLVAAACAPMLAHSHAIYATKTLQVGEGGDAIRVANAEYSPRGRSVVRALERLDETLPADATLLVMPEGVALNYWMRRRNPTPYSLFLPTEQSAHGGAGEMLQRIQKSPPDFVVLVHRGHAEFGTGPFLRDPLNGEAFAPWLSLEYRRAQQIGAIPFQGPAFGIAVFERVKADGAQVRTGPSD